MKRGSEKTNLRLRFAYDRMMLLAFRGGYAGGKNSILHSRPAESNERLGGPTIFVLMIRWGVISSQVECRWLSGRR